MNLTAYGGDVALLTVTAPGKEQLGDAVAMRRWNTAAPDAWRAMHREASQAVQRRVGRRPKLLGWSWEYQRRGALHKHVLVGMGTAADRRAAHLYAREIDRIRGRCGFGFISDSGKGGAWRRQGLKSLPAETSGRYVAKYLSPLDANGKPTLSETVTRLDVPPLVVYVSRDLTRVTGCTMRWLRYVRLAWFLGIDPMTGEVVRGRADGGQAPDVVSTGPTRGP